MTMYTQDYSSYLIEDVVVVTVIHAAINIGSSIYITSARSQ